jgi:hypothetical protein
VKTHFWPIYLVLAYLLAGCATMPQRNTYVTLDGDVVSPGQEERPTTTLTTFNESSFPEVWVVALEGNNSLIRKTLWEVGNETCYQVTVPKQEMVTIMICWFDERGNKVTKEWQKVTRQTLASRPLEVHITDFMLCGQELQEGVIINLRSKTIECWDEDEHYFQILPGKGSEPFLRQVGYINLCWRELGSEDSWQEYGPIDDIRDEFKFGDRLYDFRVRIIKKKTRCE